MEDHASISAEEQAFLDEALAPVREGEEIDVAVGREVPEHMLTRGRHRRERYWEKRLADGRAKYGDGVWFGVEEGNITIMRTRRSNFKAGRTTHPDGIWECLVVRDEPRLPPEKGMLLYRYLGEGTMPVPVTDEFFEFYKEKDPRCVLNDVVYRDVANLPQPEPVEENPVAVPETTPVSEDVVPAPVVQQAIQAVEPQPVVLTVDEFVAQHPEVSEEPIFTTDTPPDPTSLNPSLDEGVAPQDPEYTPPVEVSSGLLTPEQLAEIQARYVPVDDDSEIDLLPPFGGSPTVYEATSPIPVHTNEQGRNVIPGLEDIT